jgi:DNA-binding winged helix-turn-helix (wHTH) protein/tetratricopeptide (TPR) repeat protein
MGRVGFHDVVFDEGFASAVRAGGAALRFTRQERALLSQLAAHPRRLFTRDELHVALGSTGSDRNVDFVINRLRAKLGDTGPERRFISTQYGEGYVWVASAVEVTEEDGFLVVGPVRGLTDASLDDVLKPLQAALQAHFGNHRSVVLEPERRADATNGFRFSVEVSFHAERRRLHAAFVLRQAPGREVVASFREEFAKVVPRAALDALAGAITQAVWKRLALGPPTAAAPNDPPLQLRMHAASVLLDPPGAVWRSNAEQLARLRAQDPADPRLAIMWAMHLFVKMTIDPGSDPLSRKAHTALVDEVEQLVLDNLMAVRADPVMALAAAKLLLGLHRGHEGVAESLAETVFHGSAAFAAAFPLLGQIKAYRGDLAEARRLYDEGLKLCEPGSAFEVYIQILKAQTLIAQEDYAAVEAVYRRVVDINPEAQARIALLFLPPGDDGLARTLAPFADRASQGQARRTIAYLHYLAAPYFRGPGHAANIMRGPLTHLVRRFGPTVASEEIWAETPAELHYLRAAPSPAVAEQTVSKPKTALERGP